MNARNYTSAEAKELAVAAAQEALARFAAERPNPSWVTLNQAADMLKVSTRTVQRLNPPRVGGKIPYSWIVKQASK